MRNRWTGAIGGLAVLALAALFLALPATAQTNNRTGGGSGQSSDSGSGDDPFFNRAPAPVGCRFPEVPTLEGGCACAPGYVRFSGMCTLPPPVVRGLDPVPEPTRPARPRRVTERPVRIPPPPDTGPQPKPNGVAGFDLPGRPCLDPDLHAILVAAYGPKPDLQACAAACLPRPPVSLLPEAKLQDLAAANDVTWCPDECVALSGYLPVTEVVELERLTGRTFCMSDGAALCRLPGFAAVPAAESEQRLRAIVGATPPAPPRSGDLAILIGNADYDQDWPDKQHGIRDAAAMRLLLVEKLGFAADDVIYYENANDRDFDDFFGPGGWIDERKPTGSLFVYVSAHGLSDPATGASYVLPVDALPEDVENTSVPLEELYAAIARIGAKSTTLVLEVDFVTDIGDLLDPPNLPQTEVAVLPATPVPGLTILTATDRDQRALADPELGTGLFTRHLVEGLAGAADDGPIGNGDKRIEAVELYVYTAHRVRVSARKSFGLEQKPLLGQTGNMLIGAY